MAMTLPSQGRGFGFKTAFLLTQKTWEKVVLLRKIRKAGESPDRSINMASCKSPYEPREDSTLLESYVREYAKGNVLDMGTGSGIQAITAAHSNKVESVLAADVQKSAIDYCRKCIKNRKIKFIISNLFDNIKNTRTKSGTNSVGNKTLKIKKFDAIIFNPPYLPQELKVKDLTLEGGKKGYEVIERFLNEANNYLEPGGIILIVFSSLTKKEKVDGFIRNNLLEFELLEKQHYFFEDLYVYKIWKSDILKELEKNDIKSIKYFAKGKRGLVFTGVYKGKKAGVKINNPESSAIMRVENEAKFLKLLNKKGIGPKLLLHGKGFLAYGFVEGHNIADFFNNLENNNKNANKNKIIINIIKKTMKQLYIMDKLRINKQEMSHPQKHIIIEKSNNPVLIDFERCKYTLNPGNVTQFCDFLASNNMLTILKDNKIEINKENMIEAARRYKKQRNKNNFNNILNLIN